MHEKDQQIIVLNNQIKELKEIKKNIKKNNEKQDEKGLNVEEQLKEFGYGKIMRNKDEQRYHRRDKNINMNMDENTPNNENTDENYNKSNWEMKVMRIHLL